MTPLAYYFEVALTLLPPIAYLCRPSAAKCSEHRRYVHSKALAEPQSKPQPNIAPWGEGGA
jgi:hypothetical protein